LIEKVILFDKIKHFIIFCLISLLLFSFNLFLDYKNYKEFTAKKTIFLNNAFIENQYIKKNKFIFKLRYKDMLFYTSSKENLKNIKHRFINILILTNRISFFDYLSGFYATSLYIELHKKDTFYQKSLKFISSQHNNKDLTNFYQAIFLASSLSPKQRKIYNLYGISHLIAISGFHISILIAVLFFILNPLYKIFQQKYFPYRNRWIDLSLISLVILIAYLYFVGSPPSLLRSLFMYGLAIIFVFSHIKILSFNTLLITAIFLISLNPRLLFSLGFFLSISGVFYIYLFLHYFKDANKVLIIFVLNIFLFLMMLPIVHYFFYMGSLYQMLSIPLSILFSIFYPISLFLHIFQIGYLFDSFILKMINIKISYIQIQTPLYLYIGYILSSIMAIRYKIFFYLSLFVSLIFFIFIVISNSKS
jgi:competence protein ComEC